MIRTAAAFAAIAGLLAACNDTTSGHHVKTLHHYTVEALIEQQAHTAHAVCNHGHDMPEKPAAHYTCTRGGHTYTVVITNPHTGSYTIR